MKLLSLVLFLLAFQAQGETLSGRVVAIADGDTLTVLVGDDQHKIRLSGIDTPERRQPFGQRAKQSLSDLAYGRSVSVDWSKRDRYGRIVGKVLADGDDVNLEQVRRGLAWWYRKYLLEQAPEDRERYAKAEHEARGARRGLWADLEPIPPWDWRRIGRLISGNRSGVTP